MKRVDSLLNIVEGFTGIGAQTTALKRANIDHKIINTIEWETSAIYAYDILHNGPQDISLYRHHTKKSLIEKISDYNISNDGRQVSSSTGINMMSMIHLKSVLYSIQRNNNLVDIKQVTADVLPNEIDLFTYSFPCQDLSVSSNWWNNDKGINKDSGGQSSLLWEIGRLLSELKESKQNLPKFLLMENVSAILSSKHIKNFNEWTNNLTDYGYYNKVYTLNASDFGIPQNRERTYMISIFTNNDEDIESKLENFFFMNNLESVDLSSTLENKLGDYLRLDYNNEKYRREAINSTPRNTPSRKKIFIDSIKLAIDDMPVKGEIARTVTTKQDRNPNSGIIVYDKLELILGRDYRNITPREAFMLMGYKEETFNRLLESNIEIGKNRSILPDSKLLKLAGNSIVIDVLTEVFLQIEEINQTILK